MAEREFESLTAEQHKFEEVGEVIEGYYRGSTVMELDDGPATRVSMDTDEGPRWFWANTSMNTSLQMVDIGDFIRITYSGETDKAYKGGTKAKLYQVDRAVG